MLPTVYDRRPRKLEHDLQATIANLNTPLSGPLSASFRDQLER
jgi:hypothetical protein